MGTSADGILAYGYDLGEDFGIEYGQPDPAWATEDGSYSDDAARTLFAAVGVNYGPDDYMDPDDLMAKCGVGLVYHCSDRCTMYILAAKHITASRGYPQAVDLSLPDNADERLAWAVSVLGLNLGDKKPAWLLASYWG